MVKYVYYNADTMQVEAEFDTPVLAVQSNWAAKGLDHAMVPEGMTVTRDHLITDLDRGNIVRVIPSLNPVQPRVRVPTEVDTLRAKIRDGVGTLDDLLRIEQIKQQRRQRG